ncbi:DUF7352 domain-containing protein [Corynebacterium sp. A21]|uniref:DUF7352 domain-containing protein n=1 Tax=Corynebacterium sp. A21 TaxID=3457318 RepID=UPI003FD5FB03
MSDRKAIWKYTFQVSDVVTLQMPGPVKFLSMVESEEYGHLTLWAEVYPDSPMEDQVLRVFGTGHGLPHIPMDYIGSTRAGALVWHVYHDYTKRSLR